MHWLNRLVFLMRVCIAENRGSWAVGFVAILAACISSGFAGACFEKILKNTASSMWLRNVQLALIGMGISFGTTMLSDNPVQSSGFFDGFNQFVITRCSK